MDPNSVDQEQTALIRAVCSGSTLFAREASKTFQQTGKQTTFVATGAFRVKQQSQSFWMKNFVISFMIFSKNKT